MRFEGSVIRKSLGVGALAALLLTSAAGPASAVVFTEFNNNAAGWAAAVGGFVVENFADTTLQPGISYVLTGSGHPAEPVISGGVFNDRLVPGSFTTWTFAVPIYGFGGLWNLTPAGPGTGIDVFADGLGVFTGPSIDRGFSGQFWGFTSDTPFTTVVLQSDGQSGSAETYNLNNMVYAPVPEPGTMLLVGSGLVGLALKRRRRA